MLFLVQLIACAANGPKFEAVSNARVGVVAFAPLEKLCHVHSGITKSGNYTEDYPLPNDAASRAEQAAALGITNSGNVPVNVELDMPLDALMKLSGSGYKLTSQGRAQVESLKAKHNIDYLAVPWIGFSRSCYGVTLYTGRGPTGNWYPAEVFSPHRMQIFELEGYTPVGDTKSLGDEDNTAKKATLPKDAKRLSNAEILEYAEASAKVREVALRRFFSGQ